MSSRSMGSFVSMIFVVMLIVFMFCRVSVLLLLVALFLPL